MDGPWKWIYKLPPFEVLFDCSYLSKEGGNSVVLMSVTIGRNAVIGAGSVVTRDIPDNAVTIGNSARVIRYINNDQ